MSTETALPSAPSKPSEASRYYHHKGRMYAVSRTWVIGDTCWLATYVSADDYDKLLAYCKMLEEKSG